MGSDVWGDEGYCECSICEQVELCEIVVGKQVCESCYDRLFDEDR